MIESAFVRYFQMSFTSFDQLLEINQVILMLDDPDILSKLEKSYDFHAICVDSPQEESVCYFMHPDNFVDYFVANREGIWDNMAVKYRQRSVH